MKEEIRRIYRKLKCILKSIPKKTSDLTNDGENGIDPFVTASTLPPSISDTDSLAEGVTNLYYTDTRVNNNLNVLANTAARHNAATIGTSNGLSISGTQQISLDTASSSTTGALTNTDWNTFNNKVPTSRTISTTAPLAGGGSLASNRTLSIAQAGIASDGYLSSVDWNTFNNKISNATHTGDATGSTVLTLATVNSNIGTFGTTLLIPRITVNAKGLVTAVSNQTIPTANGSTTGLLTNTDWTTFNNKLSSAITNLNGLNSASQIFALGLSGTAPAFSSSGSTHTLNIPVAGIGVLRGLVDNGTQTLDGAKTFNNFVTTNDYYNVNSANYKTTGYRQNNFWALRTDATSLNTFIANNNSFISLTGTGNYLIGRDTGKNLLTGSNNIAIGSFFTLRNLTNGSNFIVLGANAFDEVTAGLNSIGIGDEVGKRMDTINYSILLGSNAGRGNFGTNNTVTDSFIAGRESCFLSQSISNSIIIGFQSGYRLQNSFRNILLGDGIQVSTLTGGSNLTGNTILGHNAANAYIGNNTTIVGYLAATGSGNGGDYNTYLGYGAGQGTTTVNYKLAISCHHTNILVTGDGATKQFNIDGRLRVGEGTGTATAGDIRYNTSTNKHQGYNGTTWNDLY